jgi:hypothetical protein
MYTEADDPSTEAGEADVDDRGAFEDVRVSTFVCSGVRRDESESTFFIDMIWESSKSGIRAERDALQAVTPRLIMVHTVIRIGS